jgi:hypothetical protein
MIPSRLTSIALSDAAAVTEGMIWYVVPSWIAAEVVVGAAIAAIRIVA